MNGTEGMPLRIWRLMDAHLNGTVSVEEMQELDALLIGDERAGRTFLEYTRIHAELHLLAAARSVSPKGFDEDFVPPEPSQPIASSSIGTRPRRSHHETAHPETAKRTKSPLRGFLNRKVHRNLGAPGTRFVEAAMWMAMLLCAGMAAGLLVMVGVLLNGIHLHFDQPGAAQSPSQAASASHSGTVAPAPAPPGPAAIAQLTREVHCHWISRENVHRAGDQLIAGEQLELAAGVVELRFDAGVKVVLQGPARAELTSAKAMRLQSGKMTAEILRPEARGFQVQTPKGKVVDLGTEFGIEVTPSQDVEVHVFKGEVVVKQSADASAAGGSHIFRNQGLRMESGFAGPQLFEELGETFIRTIDEADRDKHVVAYWRFEDHPVGEAVPDTSGNRKAVRGTVDSSFNGNDLFTYSAASRPRFSADVPAPCREGSGVLQSGVSNRGCLDNTVPPVDGAPTRDLYTRSRVSHAAPIDIQTIKLAQWTVEASVKAKALNMGSQTFVGRDGGRGAVMAFRINAQDRFEIFFSDVKRHTHTAVSKMPVKANQWYHLAAVSDGVALRLYIDERNDMGYLLRATSKLNPARGPTALGATNPDAQWSVGRGRVNRLTCEWFQGWIDEVRICDVALEPGEFLFAPLIGAERGESIAAETRAVASTKSRQTTGARAGQAAYIKQGPVER